MSALARFALLFCLLVAACGPSTGIPPAAATLQPAWVTSVALPTRGPAAPALNLALSEKDVKLQPLPIRAGVPFTASITVHNDAVVAATVPILVYVSAAQEQIGFSPFLEVLTGTVPATQSLTVQVPVVWNLAGGEHQMWVRVNSLPEAWAPPTPLLPEASLADNAVLIAFDVAPFDAYVSDVCAGRVDVGLDAGEVWAGPDAAHLLLRLRNLGNQAVYHLPVVVTGRDATGIAYTPAIAPCGGTADVTVALDRALQPGEPFRVQVNPPGWPDGLAEDNLENNVVSAVAGSAESTAAPPPAVTDYDFSLAETDVDVSQPGILLLTVHNRGTRDAANVPVRIENKAGRKLLDVVPLVEGGGLGVAAIQLGALWTAGGVLTVTLNPADAKGAYPEANRSDNVRLVTLPKKN